MNMAVFIQMFAFMQAGGVFGTYQSDQVLILIKEEIMILKNLNCNEHDTVKVLTEFARNAGKEARHGKTA